MSDGDLVLVDCAPDYGNYTSDLGRMWPVNGTYSDEQRVIYGFVVEYHKVLLELIRPGRMVAEFIRCHKNPVASLQSQTDTGDLVWTRIRRGENPLENRVYRK